MPPQQGPEVYTGTKSSLWVKWKPPVMAFVGRFVAILGGLTTFLWMIVLWDSYRPKITVYPGGTLQPKYPFATIFIMQNQGPLPIENVEYNTEWTYKTPNDYHGPRMTNFEQNITIIRQLDSLECYGFTMNYHWLTSNSIPPPGVAILLRFQVGCANFFL